MQFDQILGNEKIKSYLKRSLEENSLNNTLLFLGPEGIGKGLFAKALAKDLLEVDEKRIDQETHPDYTAIYPDPNSGLHSIEKIRFLIEEVYKPPFEAKGKVFVIHDAQNMLASSANALLKTLEEPTPDTTIVLLASSKEALLPTIVSRCKVFAFDALLEKDIKEYLTTNLSIEEQKASLFAKRAEGSLGNGITFATDESFAKKEKLLIEILKTPGFLLENAEKIQSLLDEEKKEQTFSKTHVDLLLKMIYMWLRDLHSVGFSASLFYPEYKEILLAQSVKKANFETVKKALFNFQDAVERNIRFSSCLMQFFLEIRHLKLQKV
jgi:DNA polymerase-3 subunit delta'